jgi:hypothetical protein
MTQALPRTYQELLWLDDLDPGARETASDLDSLEQDVLHIISEELGSNLDDPNRGVGAVGYLGGTAQMLQQLGPILDAQLADDPRITNSHTTTLQQSDGTWIIRCEILVSGEIVALQFKLGPDGLTVA